jgi:hypothetical protein
VGNVMILIPSKGAADTCRSKFGSRSPVGNPTGESVWSVWIPRLLEEPANYF